MKLLLAIMMTFSFFSSPITGGESLSVISSVCTLYESASFDTPAVDNDGNEIVFKHGDKLIAITEEGDFVKVLIGGEKVGFIFKYYVTTNKNGQDVYPVFNGKVIKEGSEIFNIDGSPSGHFAKQNQGIFIYGGIDGKKDKTEVAIVLEDGSLFYGQIATADIAANGVSSTLIISITVIIALVTIITSVVFIRKKKKSGSKH